MRINEIQITLTAEGQTKQSLFETLTTKWPIGTRYAESGFIIFKIEEQKDNKWVVTYKFFKD